MYLEDYVEGLTFKLSPISFTEQEIISFAKIHDPRPIHVDPVAAEKSRFGGLIASGFHTFYACWGKWVHTKLDEGGVVAGIGMDHLRWLNPVYPHMMLYTTLVVDKIEEKSHGDYGVVHMDVSIRDEMGKLLMEHDAVVLVAARGVEEKRFGIE
ncbi:MAG: MaoC/PaaZ C-terminal domain-containing protein [Peptoniphilus sp.]|nr:MaoC/PaaZ C-terminal domain-containing protein [Peptoniphilus sp.]MDD7363511.1 MaoC/PaaZ C-terminal domain-containing protein [Bacillota bacterium]MDY6044786.1 MaoC/PaaZ C-terminal domain-containing protein [Peptoniphilus sp.]